MKSSGTTIQQKSCIFGDQRCLMYVIIGVSTVVSLAVIFPVVFGLLCGIRKLCIFKFSNPTSTSVPPTLPPTRKLQEKVITGEAEACWEADRGVCVYKHDGGECPYSSSFKPCGRDHICCAPSGKRTKTQLPGRSNCGQLRRSRWRIVNGWETRQWPFMASLQVGGGHICGATIISRTFVITAAHCVNDKKPSNVSVVTGEQKLDVVSGHEKTFSVEKIIIHPDYDSRTKLNDLALLEVKPAIVMDAWRQPVCLPVAADSFKTNRDAGFATDVCLALGWGSNNVDPLMDHLQATALYLVGTEQCKNVYKKNFNIQKNICALMTLSDTCTGDSGGPLLGKREDRYILVGVGSLGHRVCAQRNRPSIFSNVTAFLPWIKGSVKDLPPDN